jgi:probable phosphoglycerate mutase
MPTELPKLFLARHGDTAWTESRQHTGRTDVPLNERGEQRARELGERLRRFSLTCVFTSPLKRASKTCELAGFGAVARVDPDLVEWDYGRYEAMLTRDILKERPGWELFRDGCPEGESPEDVAARADRFIARVRSIETDLLAFSSGHIIRMIAARWLGLPPGAGRFFYCRPASVGVLGFEHRNRDEPIIGVWNYFSQPRE